MWRYTLPVPDDPDRRELATAELWTAGACGVWERPTDLVGWFPARTPAVPDGGAWEEEPDRDWLEAWKAGLRPVRAGRIVVTPSWIDTEPGDGEVVLTIDPGRAFGTGHHTTTCLCLEALDDLGAGGRRVLDVGTGTGVLALAAARLGAREVVGLDLDPEAVEVARANAAANGVALRLVAGPLAAAPDGPFDLVLANLLSGTLVELAEGLAARVAPGGTLVGSGVSSSQVAVVRGALAAAGLRVDRAAERDGWAVVLARRPD